jgi:hypothetical protein
MDQQNLARTTWLVAFILTGVIAIDVLSTALVCAIAIIPEGLEAIVSGSTQSDTSHAERMMGHANWQ